MRGPQWGLPAGICAPPGHQEARYVAEAQMCHICIWTAKRMVLAQVAHLQPHRVRESRGGKEEEQELDDTCRINRSPAPNACCCTWTSSSTTACSPAGLHTKYPDLNMHLTRHRRKGLVGLAFLVVSGGGFGILVIVFA